MNFILFLLIGLIAGWSAGKIMKGRGFGFLGNLLVGVIGALVGGLLFKILGMTATGLIGSLVMAIAGSVVLLFIVGQLKKA